LGLPLFRCDRLEQLFAILNQAFINLPNLSLAVCSSKWKSSADKRQIPGWSARHGKVLGAIGSFRKTKLLAGLSEL